MKYLIHRGGQQYGPYSLEDLKQFVAQGNISPSDMAWSEGMPGWVPVSQVLGTAPVFQAAPAPAFAQPQVASPASYASAAPGGGPMPPGLHWAVVLVIGIFCGIFTMVWLFIQASFVKKIDPQNKSIMMFVLSFLVAIGCFVVFGVASVAIARSGSDMAGPMIMLLYPVVGLLPAVFSILGIFGMRRSLLNYYNTVEPIGLRLSGVMTFFFSVFYFQYHFTRITNWKTTGVLTA